MKITKTVPERTSDFIIDTIKFDLPNRRAFCYVTDVADKSTDVIQVELADILKGVSSSQLTIVKTFFKRIMAEAYEVAEADIPDTVFDAP